jgi:lipopolysaccharide assembly outer membrane protein LptD (OstA)
MRRFFPTLLLLTCALAWPAVVRAQQAVEGCTGYAALKQQSSQDQVRNPKTGVMETRVQHQGSVDVTCDNVRIVADHVEIILERSFLTATGNVVFMQQGTRINAARAEFDLKQKTGTFYVANGQLALQNKAASPTNHKMDKSLFGTLEPDAYFFGDKIEKLGPRTYRLTHGYFTTCVQPTPRWKMDESSATITVNDHIVLHNMVLRVKDVPLFYVPLLYYPLNSNDRATGLLLPSYGSSSVKGFTLSSAFFWAIGRSEDATFFYDWFSKAGRGYGTEYRYASQPGSGGDVRAYVVDLTAQLGADGTTVAVPAARASDVVGSMTQALSNNVRLQARANYFSNPATEQLLQQNLFTTLNSDRYVGANIYGNWGAWRLAGLAEVHDYFSGLTAPNRYGSAPRVTFSYAQSPIGHSKIYVGFNTEYVSTLLQSVAGDPTTNKGLSRFDVNPTIRAPIGNLSFLAVNTSASWRFTSWSQSLNPDGVQVATPIDRQMMVLQASVVGPVFTKVFDTPTSGYADRFKHVIEPSFTIQHVTRIQDFSQIVKLDAVDAIVGGATSLTYGLTNRVLARRWQPNGTAVAREIFNVGISQSYYTDQQAAAYDQQYQSSQQGQVPSNFSPIVLQTTATPADHISGQLRLEYDWQHSAMRSMSTATSVDLPATRVTATWTRQFLVPGLTGFDTAASLANTLSVSSTVRAPDNHLMGTWSWNYDFTNRYMLQQRMTGTYNAQCCGVAFEYQTVYLGNLGPRGIVRDRRFTIAFTLAGIGTFSPPFGAFGAAGVK